MSKCGDRCCKHHQHNILISLILSESTAGLLQINAPNIEDTCAQLDSRCVLEPICAEDIPIKQQSFFSYFCLTESSRFKDNDLITLEVAYFADSFDGDSDESFESLGGTEIRTVLKPVTVYTRPLVLARTVALEENITLVDNVIYVKLLDNNLFLSESQYICRICHGGESLGDLIAPCRCKGTIALTHLGCLERWLRESSNSYCELCKHHFQVVRQAKYSVPKSILMYLANPGENFRELVIDVIAFGVYTPIAISTTYMLLNICENISRYHQRQNVPAHVVAFCAVLGMATIDFTYSSWLMLTLDRHILAWKMWYRSNCFLKVLLPLSRKKAYRHNEVVSTASNCF